MSSDLLRRAATKLRETAEATSPPPWSSDPDASWYECGADHRYVRTESDQHWSAVALTGLVDDPHPRSARDAAYIALMHPPVALALAVWLEHEARSVADAVAAWSR